MGSTCKRLAGLFLSGILILSNSGCNDAKTLTKQNLEKPIQAFLDVQYPRCVVFADFPVKVRWGQIEDEPLLRVLVKSGLLTMSDVKNTSGTGPPVLPNFELTDEGKKFYQAKANGSPRKGGGFCFGKAKIKNIEQFTEPAEFFGKKVSQVAYRYEVSDIPEWVKAPEIVKANLWLASDISSKETPSSATETVVLANDGWVHPTLLK
jgi:hypothetical protein